MTLYAAIPSILALLASGLAGKAQADACHAPATPVSQVQGSGEQSPLAGQRVTVEGIITLDSRQQGGFRGFYLQQADGETDNTPSTSEALFIHTARATGKAGHRVRVEGRVKEFHGLTELTGVQRIVDCGPAQYPEPVPIRLPWPDGDGTPEHLENMRVRVANRLAVIDTYNLARYGELTLAAEPQPIPTEIMPPGPAAFDRQQQQDRQRLLLDDNRGLRYPDPLPWPPAALRAPNSVRTGDTVTGLAGVLDYRFGAWRIQPSTVPDFRADSWRPVVPARTPDATVRVMTLNLENYFNGNGQGAGFPTARGAQTPEQFRRQTARLTATLQAPDPDVIAVSEIENDGHHEHSALASLAQALGPHWHPVRAGDDSGSDAIQTALLYRADRIALDGPASRLMAGPYRQRGRRPLMQVLRPLERETALRIVVPHFKSKACRGASGPDRDQEDGQGCYSHRRESAARALVEWIANEPDAKKIAGTLITGDLNSYAMEAPLTLLRQAGFRSMVHRFHPCTTRACPQTTFRYKGRHGSLDYALASSELIPRVTGAWSWPVNAEEPSFLGYEEADTSVSTSPWRSSDHNPVIIDLAL
ncbi:ExeM/NucH family extracellular endonuclease [Marinobacter sp.]|uniref:ExeM/NucH family extracellular endonuclease n=1 Tax=Marinobacter sp. TaxID=50741 RepID=UPI0034A22E52